MQIILDIALCNCYLGHAGIRRFGGRLNTRSSQEACEQMENHETVLSEVHLGLSASSKATNVVSRFEFVIPCPSPEPTGSSNENVTSDTIADQTPQVYHNRETSVHEKNCSENLSGKVEVVEEHFAPEELKRTSGDQSPPRRNRPREVLFIEHHMATPLAAVGLQVRPTGFNC